MPRGYTSISLIGGSLDGEVIENMSLRGLPTTLSFQRESHFVENGDGSVSVVEGELSNHWISYVCEVYEKEPNEKHKSGMKYSYKEAVSIERCKANTKQGKRCLKPARLDSDYCSVVHEPD
ncbi:hypothetical protein [Vibrio penaeicida]|uniref:hypothetical protein n=1 Tax=Vibrio penaeicida TaxID=104609 RepID=UPI001CC6503E|nr:hypothetical protein [Vibrio penaeicida]